MNSGVSWQVKGVRREAMEAAREAARRSGMSVAEWLDTVIAESTRGAGVDAPKEALRPMFRDEAPAADEAPAWRRRYSDHEDHQDVPPEPDISDVNARLDALSRQIDGLNQANALTNSAQAIAAPARRYPDPSDHAARTPRPIHDALSRLDGKIDRAVERRTADFEIDRRASAIDRAVGHLEPAAAGSGQMAPVDQALAEIEARQRDLDGEAPAPRVEFARAPTQRLPDLENQLRQVNSRMEGLRPCGLDHAVDTLRDDLAEIGVMLKDAMPRKSIEALGAEVRSLGARIDDTRHAGGNNADLASLERGLAEIGGMLKDALPKQSIEALESEVRSLGARIDDTRHAGGNNTELASLERGLAEVRDVLLGLTSDSPAESVVPGFDQAMQGLSEKIDRLSASGQGQGQDPDSIRQLENAILALREVVSQVTPDEAFAALSEEMRALSHKVDQVAGTSSAFSAIERRIASLSDSLQQSSGPGQDIQEFEAMVASLSDKIERLHAAPATDQTAVRHLEDRIVQLVEKIDASDARLNQLGAIERGLADLLIYIEHQQAAGAQRGELESAEANALKRDVQRTQDSLESVHGALGQVVDRLATIESSIRDSQLPRVANIPEQMPAAAPPSERMARYVHPAGSESDDPGELEPAPAPLRAAPPPPPALLAAPAAAAMANPAPAAERRPIDPNLPPDHPLEPGAVRGRNGGSPTDRIAASEAALENMRPPVIPDPGGKSNFIAAARRAAQAAMVEAPPPKDKAAAGVAGVANIASSAAASISGRIGGKVRKVVVGAGLILFILGALHFVATRIWFSGTSPEQAAQVPLDDAPTTTPGRAEPPAPDKSAPTKSAPTKAAPERQSAVVPPGFAFPPGSQVSVTGIPGMVPASRDADREVTGSIPQPAPQTANNQPAGEAPLPAPARGNNADRLPANIGSGGLRAAALRGDPTAEFEIATRFAEGRGVPQSLTEAAAWFERAASKGLVPAQFRLGGLYEKGIGVAKNIETARRLYVAAAEAGNAKAMHNLAVLYAEGIDGKADYQTAARWFRKAADHGVADSQYNLAILYARGIGVETNLAEAFKWFALANREGDRDAARKRDDVAARLDKQSLAAAMAAAQAWQPQPQPQAALQVPVPSGGWDGVPTPSTPKRSVGPK